MYLIDEFGLECPIGRAGSGGVWRARPVPRLRPGSSPTTARTLGGSGPPAIGPVAGSHRRKKGLCLARAPRADGRLMGSPMLALAGLPAAMAAELNGSTEAQNALLPRCSAGSPPGAGGGAAPAALSAPRPRRPAGEARELHRQRLTGSFCPDPNAKGKPPRRLVEELERRG